MFVPTFVCASFIYTSKYVLEQLQSCYAVYRCVRKGHVRDKWKRIKIN